MLNILDSIVALPAFDELARTIRGGESPSSLGLARAIRLPLLAALQQDIGWPIVLLTDKTSRALNMLDELAVLAPQTKRLLFPEPTSVFYENMPWGEMTRLNRITTLHALAALHMPLNKGSAPPETSPFIIAPIRAVMTKTLPRRDFIKYSQILKKGQRTSPEELMRQMVAICYTAVNMVTSPGQYARRGGILDIWPITDTKPVRLDFFGDEIDSLRIFDPATQRTIQPCEQIAIAPAREFILTPEVNIGTPENPASEFHIPLLYPQASSLLNYLPSKALLCVDDETALIDTIDEVEKQAISLRSDATQNSALPEDYPLPYFTREDIESLIEKNFHLILGPAFESFEDADRFSLRRFFSPGKRYGGRVKNFFDDLGENLLHGCQSFIISRQTTRLKDLWKDHPASGLNGNPDNPCFIQGSLTEGWVLTPPDDHGKAPIILYTDGEIFGWQPPQARRRPRPTAEEPEAAFADLNVDDLVVHIDHGIGVFKGMVRRVIENIENEYLEIEYAQGDQLFVPIYQADRVTRYVGADSHLPPLHRLGNAEWQSVKSRVKEGVEEVARDLLDLYATRQVVKGYAFKTDTPWQHELEASFPYVETNDQLRVLAEVKKDMESPRPMDRLICGDVGYGKTEIALRAAFKSVMDGKQAAILVPTTVLAQQHFNTFCERLSPFPITVEMLSRFRTPQEQQSIVTRLKEGGIDIIIGTHRLFSSDVHFKDLGLLVIDEEQRFGVTHKETLKKMRSEIDVLTLTATPIPRTLYMALTDIRDISTINTPPAERLPIITHVGPYSPRIVRQAVLRELERGGQVFFVHNRVQTIEGMRSHLEKLLPEAHISVVHGQMSEQALSHRMAEFTNPDAEEERIDILLATSIIESGLDIPNANTLIVDRADTFGLAQLYQLRGRIGRGAQRAYAYFFRHNKIPPTPEGRQRLETLAEYTQLGAGFSIAMRDLEMRGAGELLGTQQHGQIAAVGFHLYTRLLAEAVRRLQAANGIQPRQSSALTSQWAPVGLSQPSIDLPLSISIPSDYISEKHVRLNLYRRLASIRELEEIDRLQEEFRDRFGPPPNAVQNLLFQLKVKLLSEKAGLASIGIENRMIALRYPALPQEMPQRKFPPFPRDVRIGKNSLWIAYHNNEEWPDRLLQIINTLIDFRQTIESDIISTE